MHPLYFRQINETFSVLNLKYCVLYTSLTSVNNRILVSVAILFYKYNNLGLGIKGKHSKLFYIYD